MVVGVLIGDHFSKARSSKGQPDLALNKPEPAATTPDAVPVPPFPSDRSNPSQGPQPNPTGQDHPLDPPGLVMGTRDQRAGDPPIPGFQPTDRFSPPPAVGPDTTRSPLIPGPEGINPPVSPTSPVKPTLPLSKGTEKMHPVQENETLFAIAKRYYGDSGLWKRLAEYNKNRVRSDGSVREGVTLRIPPKDVLLGQATLAPEALGGGSGDSAKGQPVPLPGTDNGTATRPGAPRTYTVKKGDSLGVISQVTLGTSRRWREILSLNSDQLSDENALQVGMVLKIPAK